ncbi:endospore germination permease [Wukongibacter baidiensis]|uniref:GerAB/ArcD/ProY family transporter n=1 Tax=Wukongibacter baidiensis TaxID=1723361 RepID=UPI003D7FE8A1
MNKGAISDREGISLIVLFLIGSSSVFVMGLEAKKDLWLADIIAMLMALAMAYIYARLHYLFPKKDLYDILELCFGKLIGRAIQLILIFFFYYWTADVMVNYGSFINAVSLDETPKIIPMMVLAVLCAWGISNGIKVMGRWSELFLIMPCFILLILTLSLIPKMNYRNLLPIMGEGIKPVLAGAFDAFSFPFGQIFAFSIVFTNFKSRKSPYKVYFSGLIFAGIILLITALIGILVLGAEDAGSTHYPTYATASRVEIGDLFQRIEVLVAISFVLGGFIKVGILLQCTCVGISKAFDFNDYKFLIIPIMLLVINLSYFQYDSIIHYNRFQADTWLYFTFPFQVILPIIIWIAAEIRKKRIVEVK